MNVSPNSVRPKEEGGEGKVVASAAGGGRNGGAEMTYQHHHNLQHVVIKTEPQKNEEGEAEGASPINPAIQSMSEDDDIIEVFRFDRNSLKLRCEEISPKQLKKKQVQAPAIAKDGSTVSALSSPSSSSSSSSSSSGSGSSSSSSSGSSSSSDSDDSSSEGSSSSSSTSSSSSSKTTSAATTATTSTSSASSSKNLVKIEKKASSNKKKDVEESSSCSSSSSSSSSSSDETDGEKNAKNKKLSKKKSKEPKITNQSDLKISKTNGSFSNTLEVVPLQTAVKIERIEEDEELSSSVVPSRLLKVEDEEDDDEAIMEEEDEYEDDEKVNIDDLMDGRNKQRKNSKWGDYVGARKSSRLPPRESFCNKKYEAQMKKRLRTLLKKDPSEWTEDDRTTIHSFPKLVEEVEKRLQKTEVASLRLQECEDPPDLLDKKCAQLASVISRARYLIIYTGAGISTSAKIPDYRGPNGIWTLLQKGEQVTQSLTDISQTADPTLTHMAIKTLYDHQVCKHVVSQNVDGLHIRSGIPKVALSEVHGNMYIEACTKCAREFVRLFDVTENTRRHHHKTGRFCYHCGNALRDTVVLFGEKGSLRWPLNWQGAEYNVDKADVILCLGSSLKVLRRYPWLWSMAKPPQKRPKLYIVNLQWTPKDQFARLKINGKCDEVMEKIMRHLNLDIPEYSRVNDAIFKVATLLHPAEDETKSSGELWWPPELEYPEKNKDLRNYIRFEPVFKVPIPYQDKSLLKMEGGSGGVGEGEEDDVGQGGEEIDEAALALKQEQEEQAKQRKRVLKGNNFSWLGNAVISKQQKKRKLK